MGRNALPQQADRTQPERASQPESEKTTAVEVHGPRNLSCFKLLKLFMLSRVNQRLGSSTVVLGSAGEHRRSSTHGNKPCPRDRKCLEGLFSASVCSWQRRPGHDIVTRRIA